MPPYQFGGDMISKVDFAGTTFRAAPERFEAGTPDISGAIGLGVALEYFMPIQPPRMRMSRPCSPRRPSASRLSKDLPSWAKRPRRLR